MMGFNGFQCQWPQRKETSHRKLAPTSRQGLHFELQIQRPSPGWHVFSAVSRPVSCFSYHFLPDP